METSALESLPAGTGHLDTVRSLHQTVVSLRNALEVSKSELHQLKERYKQHSDCINCEDLIKKLTLENHVLRRKIIDTGQEDISFIKDINLQVTCDDVKDIDNVDNLHRTEHLNNSNKKSESNRSSLNIDVNEEISSSEENSLNLKHEENLKEELKITSTESSPRETESEETLSQINITKTDTQEVNETGFRAKLELLSKFDVKIKVCTLKDGVVTSTTTSDTESTLENTKQTDYKSNNEKNINFKDKIENNKEIINPEGTNIVIESVTEDIVEMAVPNEVDARKKSDNFDVQVRIISEENLVVNENVERSQRNTLTLDVDDLSYRSISEGDNSVFSDTTPADPSKAQVSVMEGKNVHKDLGHVSDDSEEVDDIELIFTTDDSKDVSNLQEDLVPIREHEYGPSPTSTTHSTPVLVRFHTLDPDFHAPDPKQDQSSSNLQAISEMSLKQKRVSLPNDKEIRRVYSNVKSLDLPGRGILKSSENKSDNYLYRKSPNASTRRLDSSESFSYENRGFSFDMKSSSYDIGSSMDVLQRDESVDSFNKHFGHRFSVFAETDISKCGTSEDDFGNLNARRNTCPNPFQFRRQQLGLRPYVPKLVGGVRGVVRGRRESGAQTDLSALPKWGSDGHLARPLPIPPRATSRRPPAPLRAPPPQRQLLSDIDFTSMVPELSRSADPLCAIQQACNILAPRTFRSPCLSVNRSDEWTPQMIPVPNKYKYKYGGKLWRTSLPDVRHDDTDELLEETEAYLRRSIDNLQVKHNAPVGELCQLSRPYIPTEPRHLRLGHAVKVITPQGRVAVGRVRYVGLAGGTARDSEIMVGAIFLTADHQYLPANDGSYRSRRYFVAPSNHTALFVPFRKVLLAWAN